MNLFTSPAIAENVCNIKQVKEKLPLLKTILPAIGTGAFVAILFWDAY